MKIVEKSRKGAEREEGRRRWKEGGREEGKKKGRGRKKRGKRQTLACACGIDFTQRATRTLRLFQVNDTKVVF